MKISFVVICFILLGFLCGFGNALMIYQNESQLIRTSDQIVYGKIVDIKSAWNAQNTHIETTAQVLVDEAFMTSDITVIDSGTTVPVTILGGMVGDIYEWVEDQPVFLVNTDAFVYLKKSADGKFTVNGQVNGVHPVFMSKTGISSIKASSSAPEVERFKEQIHKTLQGIPTDLNPPGLHVSLSTQPTSSKLLGAPIIYSVTPSSASAGTDSVITITGSGFGTKASRTSLADVIFFSYMVNSTTMDSIFASGWPFYDNNPGPGLTLNGNCIVSWTDTQIQVKVPSGLTYGGYWQSASSGFIRVLTDTGEIYDIPFEITFGFPKNYGTARFKWDSGAVPYYVNPGSYSGAGTAIQNAAATWNNAGSSFRFNYGGTSSSTVYGNNGVNLIFFSPISDPSTIAQTACFYTTNGGFIECDTVLDSDDTQWTTGTASGNTFNIEAITAHEIGHWLQLQDLYGDLPLWGQTGYPSDTNKMMFGIRNDIYGNMNLKTLSTGDTAGIQWIYPPLQPKVIIEKSFQFGKSGDTPIVGNWNGDEVADVGIFRALTGYWYLDTGKTGLGYTTIRFGKSGDIPVVGDWNGDGTSDAGVFRPSVGTWYLDTNRDGIADIDLMFGKSGDVPVTGDWNGDGKSDISVFRPSSGFWYMNYSTLT